MDELQMISVRLPKKLAQKLIDEARNTRSTVTRVVIRAVENYLSEPCPTCGGPMPVELD